MRILTWNIRAGGGVRVPGILAALAAHDADVLVLTEYRDGDAGTRLRAGLMEAGHRFITRTVPPAPRNGVLIAARYRFREHGAVSATLPEPWRMVDVSFGRLRVSGVYMPNLRAKVPYWRALIDTLGPRAGGSSLALGDFNTCRAYVDEPGAFDVTAYFLDEIAAAGFRDLWRGRFPDGREFSWYSHRGNGFRIDHAFGSPRLDRRVRGIRYSHGEREAGLSDHSPLMLDLD